MKTKQLSQTGGDPTRENATFKRKLNNPQTQVTTESKPGLESVASIIARLGLGLSSSASKEGQR